MQAAAEEGKEKHVAQLLDEGVKALKRRELRLTMVDAKFKIEQGKLKQARPHQENASKTIAQTVDALHRASDALSGTKEGALERAARRARDIKKKGLELAGLDEKDVPDAAKTDDGKKDDDAKDDSKKDDAKKDDGKKDGDDTELSRPRRRQEADKLWGEVRTLAQDLQAMDVVPKNVADRLSDVAADDLREMFDKRQREEMVQFISLVAAVSKSLDEKLLEAQTAKKLESGLRDECPPAYRRLVGKYYTILSAGE